MPPEPRFLKRPRTRCVNSKTAPRVFGRSKPEDVDFIGGKVISRNNGVPPMTIKELATKFGRTGGPVSGQAGVSARGAVGTFAGCCVDVEVDPETGKTQILRATIAQDAGKAIHPSYVEGQMQGGTSQGIGWALNEEYIYDEKGNLETPASSTTGCRPAWICR